MRRNMYRIALVFAAVFAMTMSIAFSEPQTVFANIPFDFNAGNLTMQAGNYLLRMNDPVGSIMIRNKDARASVWILVNYLAPQEMRNFSSKMVFHKYGTHYFLAKVIGRDGVGCGLSKGKLEKEIAIRAANSPAETILLALADR